MKQWYVLLLCVMGVSSPVLAHDWKGARPDGHAPIGVMGDHNHKPGEVMVSYRAMTMEMEGNRTGTNRVSEGEVLSDYIVTPTKMRMNMHMYGIMVGLTKNTTMMAMVPYKSIHMGHRTRTGLTFHTNTSGLGDISVGGITTLKSWHGQKLLLNSGIGLPTGSISERGDTPLGTNGILPYPMQLGSGTFSLLPGVTYLGQKGDWSWGSQAKVNWRLGRNSQNYALGDEYNLTGWGARKLSDWFSLGARLNGKHWGDVDGGSSEIVHHHPMNGIAVVPTAQPELRGGRRIDASISANVYVRSGWLKGHRLALEYAVPVYQNLRGPQMETDRVISFGWQYAW